MNQFFEYLLIFLNKDQHPAIFKLSSISGLGNLIILIFRAPI